MSTSFEQGCVSSSSHFAVIYHDLVAAGHVDYEVGQKPRKAKARKKRKVTDLMVGPIRLHSLQAMARVRWMGKMGLAGADGILEDILRAFVVNAGLMDFVCCHRK